MPGIARVTDTTTGHDSFLPSICDSGSPDTFTNNLANHRVSDHMTTHCRTVEPFDCHDATLSTGSSTVITNGKGQGRTGDTMSCSDHIATGSTDCIID